MGRSRKPPRTSEAPRSPCRRSFPGVQPTIPPMPPNLVGGWRRGGSGGSRPACRRQSNFPFNGDPDNLARSPTRHSPRLFAVSSDARPRGDSEKRWVGLRAGSKGTGVNEPRPCSERLGFDPPTLRARTKPGENITAIIGAFSLPHLPAISRPRAAKPRPNREPTGWNEGADAKRPRGIPT